jgi:toxin ParE1/3/4
MTYRLSPKALSDIYSVTEFIGKDSKRAARQWAVELTEKFRIIGRSPKIGVARYELGEGLRSFPFGSYLIFYREVPKGIEVTRVIHGARLWKDLL